MNAVQLEDGLDEIVEISTFIRERPVACRWSSGVVTGDAELLGRLSQTTAGRNWAERPSSVARAVSAAVGSPVTIRVLDELEVLTHSAAESTIVAETEGTRVLAVPVDSFDAMLERDPDFARRVLDLESRQLQRLTRAGGTGALA